ncbi:hypothetical protein ACXR8F_20010 [Terrabacter sp. AAH1]
MAAEPRTSRPLSSDLVLALVSLVPDELAAGFRMGLLDRSETVHVAERMLSEDQAAPDWVQQIAVLMPDKHGNADDVGTAAIVARWRSYLDRRAEYYAGRSAS